MFKPMQELTIEKGVETEKAKSKVYLFLGALGSGKTTLINNLSQNFPENTLVIINDVWSINIDVSRINWLDTIPLQNWCICCDDTNSLEDVLKKIKEDERQWTIRNIIIEPSGIAGWTNIKKILNRNWFETKTITLVDENHFEQRTDLEKRVNERIKESIKRDIKYLPKEEAFKLNSMHLFGEKYSDIVRVVSFNDSIELCGGCHVENTSLIGKCAILSIESKGSNIYRIEATHEEFIKTKVKEKVNNYLEEIEKIVKKSRNIIDSANTKNITLDFKLYFEEKELNSYESIVYYKNITESLKNDVIELEKEYKEKVKIKVLDQIDKYISEIKEVKNIKYLIFGVKEIDVKTAKELLDNISNQIGEIFIFIVIKNEDSLTFVAKSTNKLSAVDYLKYFANITSGNGGGNNLLATGGTKEAINIEKVRKQLEEKLIEDTNK